MRLINFAARQNRSYFVTSVNILLHCDCCDQAELKKTLAAEVQELVNGMVLLQIPDELAWLLFIDSRDCECIGRIIKSSF